MNHQLLVINGSSAFRKSVLETSIQDNLTISFHDKNLQREFVRQNENEENERKNFVANGGRILTRRLNTQSHTSPTHAKSIRYQSRILLANIVRTPCASFKIKRNGEKTRTRCEKFLSVSDAEEKDGSESSFEEKWKCGALKNRNWANKNFLSVLRGDLAQIQNEVLEQNGFSIRVDHRSLKAQKEEAERNGDSFLARLFNRIPEEYIGVISCKDDDNEQLERLKHFRNLRKQHLDLLM